LQGLDHLLAGRMDEAEAALKNYLSHTETEPGWPYSLKPLATRWLERLNTFRGTQKSARDRLAAETPAADIIRELDELRGRVSPMFQPRLAELLGEARKADRAEQSRRAAAENAARLENIQRELDLVDETIAKMQGPLLRKDFAALTSLLDAAGNALTTAEAKTALDGARDAARRLNDFKRGLGAVLAAAPFRHQELGGAATGTESGGLIVTLPNNIGTSVRPWESLSAPLFVQLAAHAANQAAAPADRADRLLAGALFAYYSGGGGLRFAVNLAGQAAQTLPELRETILRLMPDLLPPE